MTAENIVDGIAKKLGHRLVSNERLQTLCEFEAKATELRAQIVMLEQRLATQQTLAAEPPSYRYHGQYCPPVDRFIHERYFGSSLMQGRFLECGGSDGVGENCCLFFEETLGWTGINIEASPPLFTLLKNNRPKSLNVHAALSDSEGTVEFVHAYHPTVEVFGNGSIAHTPEHRELLDDMGCTYEKFSVPKITYRSLITQHNIDRLDLMILDVEGHEESALKGMLGATVLPTVMCVEFGISGAETINDLMSELGYSFDTISFGNAFYIRNDQLSSFRRWRNP